MNKEEIRKTGEKTEKAGYFKTSEGAWGGRDSTSLKGPETVQSRNRVLKLQIIGQHEYISTLHDFILF